MTKTNNSIMTTNTDLCDYLITLITGLLMLTRNKDSKDRILELEYGPNAPLQLKSILSTDSATPHNICLAHHLMICQQKKNIHLKNNCKKHAV